MVSGGRDEVAPAGSLIPVWLDGANGVPEGGRLVLGRCASGLLVGRGKNPLLVESLPLEPLLLEAPIMDPGVPAVGEVTIGAVNTGPLWAERQSRTQQPGRLSISLR